MQIASLAKKLESVGLTEKQAKVYVSALFLGPAAVQRISEQAEVNRATTYVILDELAVMGMVSTTTEGKKTVFVAEPPEAIERYLNSLQKEIELRQSGLKDVVKDLHQVNRAEAEDAPVVRFYRGPEASQAVLDYLSRKAKPNETIYSVADIDEVLKVFPDILKTGPARRKKKGNKSKVLYSGTIEVQNDSKSNRLVKRLPRKAKGDVTMYDDRMTILSYNGDKSTGVIIESREIVAVMRQIFNLAWKHYPSQEISN